MALMKGSQTISALSETVPPRALTAAHTIAAGAGDVDNVNAIVHVLHVEQIVFPQCEEMT
eukprot:CAMPEP_0181186132 /NCGR_PEP_ID=MMETSP1096-20121128/9874_1 /TAXON_ID=156174 ORGANISM="Chrysochromulina ericina, Strain CCMP281" /NCGR_SAMPLE_ID=MMETSP1096 /ASSEMBLY_ACC=CAM_ASM_000453 /LENGTH=59 /DNA_ID=CAMNT_0023275015 /DNA_START=616 /DNA_END=795 /DNA_ORIENTATION=-